MLLRILLPIAILAFFFFPWYSVSGPDPVMGGKSGGKRTAYQIISPTIDCLKSGTMSIAGECTPGTREDPDTHEKIIPEGQNKFQAYLLLTAAALAVGAILFHALGFVGIIRKFASGIGALAGLTALGSAGWAGLDVIGNIANLAQHWQDVGWGAYGTGAAALVTTVASLFGMRSEEA